MAALGFKSSDRFNSLSGLTIVLALAVVGLIVFVVMRKEGFTSNTVMQQDSDQDFYEGYIAMGAPHRVPARNIEGMAGNSYFAQVVSQDVNAAPSLGTVNLKGCRVSPSLNADPWQWMYNAVNDGASVATPVVVNAQGGAPAKEGMVPLNDANLGLAMAGGSAKRGIL